MSDPSPQTPKGPGAWWRRLFKPAAKPSLDGMAFQEFCQLFSKDGKQRAKVLVFGNGQTYLLESDRVEGEIFADRHGGGLVGPFKSPDAAERFIVGTRWFRGELS